MEEKKKTTVEMLEEEIRSLLSELKSLPPDSEQYASVSARLKEQYEMLLKHESIEKTEKREKINTITHIGLDALKFVGALAFFGYNYTRGWEFEKEGTLCSDSFKTVRNDSRKLFKF